MSRKGYDARNVLNEKKCAIYIRVSTHYQIDKDSLPLQREDLINYSKYVIGTDKYEVFEDAGYSGKNTYRPAYQQMMARLRTGEFSHVLVWKIDRISRNLLDFASMYAELKKLGVTFVSKNEQFDTSSAMGEAMLKIILVFAELERNMTSERVTAVMLSRAAGGQWNGGRVPYGYNYDKETKTFSINEQESKIVQKIHNDYENGYSMLEITKDLNGQGLKTKTGNDWTPTNISKMLTSRFYLGEYQYNLHKDGIGGAGPSSLKPEKEWITIENHHPAIITLEQWERCAALRAKKKRNGLTQETYQRKNINIFAGLIKCGKCGGNYKSSLGRERTGGYRPSIYLCSRRRQFSDCDNKFVSDVTIGQFVLNYIANMMKLHSNLGKSTTMDMFQKKLLRGDTFNDIAAIGEHGLKELYDVMIEKKYSSDLFRPNHTTENSDDTLSERELLLSERRRLERAVERLRTIYLYADEAMPEADYIIENKRLTERLDEINNRLSEIDKSNSAAFTISDNEFMEKASYFIMSQELSGKRYVNFERFIKHIDAEIVKKFINSVIKKIVVFDGKITSIVFKNDIEHIFLYE